MKFIIGSILAVLVVSGCAKDQTTDEYNREQARQELAKLQAVSGSYRGALVSNRTQKAAAAISFSFSPDAQINATGSSPAPTQQVTLQGTVTCALLNGSIRYLNFKKAVYDSTSSDFRVSVPIGTSGAAGGSSAGAPAGDGPTIEVVGSLTATSFSGRIRTANFDDYGGSFKLGRDAAMPDPSKIVTSAAYAVGSDAPAQYYVGSPVYDFDGKPDETVISFFDPASTSAESFGDLFNPAQTVSLSVGLKKYGMAQIYFPNAQWDTVNGLLSGAAAAVATNGPSYATQIRCTRTASSGTLDTLHCRLDSSARGRIFEGDFTAADNASGRQP